MKKFGKKGLGVLYGVLLFSFSTYALLDTFVIPHPMQSVEINAIAETTSTSGIKESVEAAIQSKLGNNTYTAIETDSSTTASENTDTAVETSASVVEGGTVIGQYSDSKTSITLKQYREYDSNIYVADVTVSDASDLKTALANNTYGRNITDTTSDMAANNNAVLAINGDYYGARQSGYVIRNGKLYRDTSGNRDALVIQKTVSLSLFRKVRQVQASFYKTERYRHFHSVRCF